MRKFGVILSQYKKNEKSEKKCSKISDIKKKNKCQKTGSRSGGGGSRSGGGVQIGWGGTGKGVVVEFFFCIGGMWGKNFLKFSLFFSNFLEGGGCQIGGGCRRHFLYLIFFGEFFSQIFSFFLKFSRNTFLCIGIPGKFSQIFSFFLEFSRRGGGCQIGGGCRRHFLYLTFWGKNYLNFFRFSGNAFFVLEVCWGNITPNFFQVAHGRFFLLFFSTYQI